MLILTRKPGEVICIGDKVFITVVEIKGNQIRIGIDAPKEMRVFRKEIYDQIQAENKAAADSQGLESLAEMMRTGQPNPHMEGAEQKEFSARSPLSAFTTQKVKPAGSDKIPQVVKKKQREE